MLCILKKSFNITKDNPTIVLFFVAYLTLQFFFMQTFSKIQGGYLFFASLIGILLFSCAFFSGWFGMIKKAIQNMNKTYDNKDEKYEDILNLKNDFFSSIPLFMLPLLTVFVIYYTLFILWIITAIKIASTFIGDIGFLLNDITEISGSSGATLNYLQNLPLDKLHTIYYFNAFMVLAIAIFGLFTLFLPAALYFEKEDNKNPFIAFLNAFKTVIKRPLGVLGLNIVIGILFFIMMFLQFLCSLNLILYFGYIILSIYITVFMVVLLFNYYDKRFASDCNNGCNSIG